MAATVMQFRLVCAEMQILQKHVTMGLKWSVYPRFSPASPWVLSSLAGRKFASIELNCCLQRAYRV